MLSDRHSRPSETVYFKTVKRRARMPALRHTTAHPIKQNQKGRLKTQYVGRASLPAALKPVE
ncbi:deoxycytidine triphosphate deaminase [Neisseria wadsworthii 9715]|uniref:Deoxycytidine triphosphate deaminase n=1 Tax=Neisseria wadsworthii 9715 TaxID=1030841 RepID=G4CMU9_9NEIS|nr:deoxycytidine triphosphate deaminase [Neisseria wadsworthii 9715]